MKIIIELPLIEPLYGTYHNQGMATAIIINNKSIKNWYLNEVMHLTCKRDFLTGYTSPRMNIEDTSWSSNPYIEKKWLSSKNKKSRIDFLIRELIDSGYYVVFGDVDDFYIKNKSWYRERHFDHDGMICGYDEKEKTYCLYAYDTNWVYRKFWTPKKGFFRGVFAMRKNNIYSTLCGIKAKADMVTFSPEVAYKNITKYLDSDLEKYPFSGEGDVYGIVVHKYICEYITKLINGDIPYERTDRRIFRLIWEHKKLMLDRIIMIEQNLRMCNTISQEYKLLVYESNRMRMLYASHCMKRRDSVLPIIYSKMLFLMDKERELLSLLIEEMKGRL